MRLARSEARSASVALSAVVAVLPRLLGSLLNQRLRCTQRHPTVSASEQMLSIVVGRFERDRLLEVLAQLAVYTPQETASAPMIRAGVPFS